MKQFRAVALLFIFLFCFQVQAQVRTLSLEDELYSYVLGIENKTQASRGDYIKDQLKNMGIGYGTAPFKRITKLGSDTIVVQGENIIVRAGNGLKKIVVGAHYDAVAGSPGANDNGSGVSVLLALIKHAQEVDWNYAVEFCFFDQEEAGSLGAQYYIRQFLIPKKHLAMINLDVVGSGEEVFIGPTGTNTKFMMRYIREAVRITNFPMVETDAYPASDYEPFQKLGFECISISVVPKGDGTLLSQWVRDGYKAPADQLPKVVGVMHTPNDRSKLVTPEALKMSYEFTKTLLLLLNESRK